MAYYNYGGYPVNGGYYSAPVPDQLAQLRANQYQQPMMPNNMMQTQQPQLQQPVVPQMGATNGSGILWVSGEKEAADYPVAPNSAVALWDSNNPVVYLKKADASGKPDTEIYDLVKRTPLQVTQAPVQAVSVPQIDYVTKAEFDALAARYDAMSEELAALKEKTATKSKKSAKEDAE